MENRNLIASKLADFQQLITERQQHAGAVTSVPLVGISTNCSTNRSLSDLLRTEIVMSHEVDMEPNAVTFSFADIEADKCVQLSREIDCDGVIKLTCDQYSIALVKLVSEFRLLEVFANNQFIYSAQGALFDEFDGTKIYTSDIKVRGTALERHEIVLRIPGSWQSSWIYSIEAHLSEFSRQPMITGNFDLTHVNQMLSDHQRPLSKNAQNFKTLFENFQINPPGGSTNNDVGNITRTAIVQPPKMADLLANPLLLNNLTNSSPVMTEQTILEPKPSDSSELEKPLETCESELSPECRAYINKKIMDMEKSVTEKINRSEKILTARIEQSEKNLSEKLERILALLSQSREDI